MLPVELSSLLKPVEMRVVNSDSSISRLLTDSRKLVDPAASLFFAIPTKRNNGARYVPELYKKGVRNFVLDAAISADLKEAILNLSQANVWFVSNVVSALQHLSSNHRSLFDIPVVGVTGSNGKTVVKDWIVQLLAPDHNIAANPKSYNS